MTTATRSCWPSRPTAGRRSRRRSRSTDYYDLPDCVTYTGQDPGRACVPTKRDNTSFFRATNYPVGAVDPRNPKHVVVTVGSYINAYSNEANGACRGLQPVDGRQPLTGVRTPGACNNGIIVTQSKNGGATFTGQTTDPRRMPLVTRPRVSEPRTSGSSGPTTPGRPTRGRRTTTASTAMPS